MNSSFDLLTVLTLVGVLIIVFVLRLKDKVAGQRVGSAMPFASSTIGGVGEGSGAGAGAGRAGGFNAIADSYRTLPEVSAALRRAGLESSNLMVGIDFTRSNEWSGKETFGKCMHHIDPRGLEQNPYQHVISILGRTLSTFDDDGLIPAFMFGDSQTTDRAVMPFFADRSCNGLDEVLTRYSELVGVLRMSGPTSFAPLIRAAIDIVHRTGQYHILIIIADGQVTNEAETVREIVRASHYPLSIVMVGVGDGPWDTMENFDDRLPERQFDNFQFVNFHEVMTRSGGVEATFAVHALMEIPEQFREIRRLGLLSSP